MDGVFSSRTSISTLPIHFPSIFEVLDVVWLSFPSYHTIFPTDDFVFDGVRLGVSIDVFLAPQSVIVRRSNLVCMSLL